MPAAWTNPFPGQRLARTDFVSGIYGVNPDVLLDDQIDEANLVTSDTGHTQRDFFGVHEPMHKPVIDIDLPVKVIESTTPGHHHLYIDHEMTWDQYTKLLTVMAEVGIVEPGYVHASLQRGYTAVRLPWIKKEKGQ